jgi:uncharacterized protein (DUF302 family)
MLRIGFVVLAMIWAQTAMAIEPRDGWQVVNTTQDYKTLVASVRKAVKAAPINVVTQASASGGASQQGITIPSNRVFGLYRNDYARRMLEASVASGIEAPIRMYVTENTDGTATLSYRTPSAVFAPYFDEGGAALITLAEELDAVFEMVADAAVAD